MNLLNKLCIGAVAFLISLAQAQEKSENPEDHKEDYSKKLIWFPLAYYTPESSLAGGVLTIKNFWQEKPGKTSHLTSVATASLLGQGFLMASPKIYYHGGAQELFGTLNYNYSPSKFYGRGTEKTLAAPEKFTEKNFSANGGIAQNIYSDLFVRAGVGWEQKHIIDWEERGLIQQEIHYTSKGIEASYYFIGIDWDNRDFPQSPMRGTYYSLQYRAYSPQDLESHRELKNFGRIDFDLREYVRLESLNSTLAFQWLFSQLQGELIPFQYLNSIGGGRVLRGYYAGRFRDKSSAVVQSEYRYEYNRKWSAVGFVGAARLQEKSEDLKSSHTYSSLGLGVHYFLDPQNRTKIRLDVGFGSETGFYVLLGDAF